MFAYYLRFTATVLVTLAAIPSCVSLSAPAKLSAISNNLQLASAGHTGCLPSENEISNSNVELSGVGTWNTTCNGRVYLCSAVSSGNQTFEYSCAPVAQ
jgi:hypothetical protein